MEGTDIRETIRMHVYIMRMSKNERDLIREENKFSRSSNKFYCACVR